MSAAKNLRIFALLAVVLTAFQSAYGQVYQIPISVDLNGTSADFGNDPKLLPFPELNIPLLEYNVLDTIYLDATDDTIQQVLTLSSSVTYTGVLNENHTVADQSVAGSLTISQSVVGGVLLDTGPQPVVLDPSTQDYEYLDPMYQASLTSIPVSGSYSLVTGGQTYSGGFSYSLTAYRNYPILFTSFSQSSDQSSLTVGGLGYELNAGLTYFTGGLNKFVQFTAANGFQVALQPGQFDDRLDGFSWSSGNVADLAPVPEPKSFGLLIFGFLALAFVGRTERFLSFQNRLTGLQ